jgi:hypothetical protein
MSADHSTLLRFLVRGYALALRLFPASFRAQYATEMQTVFRLQVGEASQAGAGRLLALAGRELRDLPGALLCVHVQADRARRLPFFPDTHDRTPWWIALLSLLPFVLTGPLRVVLIYQDGWDTPQMAQWYYLFLLASLALIGGGLLVGGWMKFPRWAYPYPLSLVLTLDLLARYLVYLLGASLSGMNFYLFLGAVLLVLCLPGLRSFYRQVPRDWTLLTYALYALVLYLMAGVDLDEAPRLTFWVLLPSLLAYGAALAHLRTRSAMLRVGILVAGTLLSLFIRLLPIFQGMVTPWIGLIFGSGLLLLGGALLVAILLAPMLVSRALHIWRASRPAG